MQHRDAFIVRLTKDIDNPEADRRSKDWNRRTQIKAGSRFIVQGDTIRSSEHRYAWTGERSDLGKLIMENSEKVEAESVREMLVVHDCDWGADEVLRILLKMGKLHAADFDAVANIPDGY